MNASRQIDRHQQKLHHQQFSEQGSYAFFNVLTGPQLFDTVERLLPENHRERLFPPTETLSMFLTQVLASDRSCQNAVNRSAVARCQNGFTPCSTNTSAYCRARERMPLALAQELSIECARAISDTVPTDWRFRGRPVRLVDGATVALPDTPENQAQFPQPSSQEPGLGFPQCRLVGLFCLASGALLDCEPGRCVGKGSDEQSGLRAQLDVLEAGDILIGDAFYATYFLFAELRRREIDAIFEQNGARKRKTDFRRGCRLGSNDHVIELKKPTLRPDWMSEQEYQEAPESIRVRECRVGGKILTTTFLCARDMPRSMLKRLYWERWNVELDFRNLKTTMGMEMMSCRTPEMVIKEIWVYFLAYNIIRLLMSQAAALHGFLPRQISFKHTIQMWLAWKDTAELGYSDDLFMLIAQRRVGNRPGRVEPRAMKRRPKPFPWLKEQRQEARIRIRQHGHP